MANLYRQAGVDLDAAAAAKSTIAAIVRSTFTPDVVGGIGGFGGVFAFPPGASSLLVASADSVGTKVKLAIALGRHHTIGADLVNHCVNDILCQGARPLFFLDYLGLSGIDEATVADIVRGAAAACRENGCALIGGETAVLPDLYHPGEYDLAGFIVGTVQQEQLVNGQMISVGDVLLGLPSTGLHTNGYSLARRILGLTGAATHDRPILEAADASLGGTWADALMAVHRSYLGPVGRLLDAGLVRGLAHITGGGLVENVPRMLPTGLSARFNTAQWAVPVVFTALAERGNVSRAEQFRVFNMGIGMVIAVAPNAVAAATALVPEAGPIGVVELGLQSDALVAIE